MTLAAVQKALKTRRITALPDGTIDPEAADRAWKAAAMARRVAEKVPADPTRVGLPAESLAIAQGTVRAVLVEHGAPVANALTLADVRLANEILRAKQRADSIAAQEEVCRLRQRAEAVQAIDKHIVDSLIANMVQVIWQYVDPCEVPAALDKLSALQARCVPGTVAEDHEPHEEVLEDLEGALPTPKARSTPCHDVSDESSIEHLPVDDPPGEEPDRTTLHPALDVRLVGGAGQSSPVEKLIEAMPEPIDREVASYPTLQCRPPSR